MSDYVFRRIRGRIVPIKKKDSDLVGKAKNPKVRAGVAVGGAAIAGGAAVGLASGAAYKKLMFKSTSDAIRAVDALGLRRTGQGMRNVFLKKSAKNLFKSAKLFGQTAVGVHAAGAAAATTVVGYGINKALKASGIKEDHAGKISTVASSVGYGSFLTGIYGRKYLRDKILAYGPKALNLIKKVKL